MTSRAAAAALVSAAAALAVPTAVRAHDFWIEPSSFRPEPGTVLGVRLRVGEPFHGEVFPRTSSHARRFLLGSPGGEEEIDGLEGRDPAGFVRIRSPGLHVIGYESRPSVIQIAPATFEAYLRERGLDGPAALRCARGRTAEPAREAFVRSARSLVRAAGVSGHDRPLGLPLEILADPVPEGAGPASFRLLLEGRPAEGLLVEAHRREAPEETASARTDSEGRVVLPLEPAGVWLITAVSMREAAGKPDGAQWRSLWGSLTLEVPAGDGPPRAGPAPARDRSGPDQGSASSPVQKLTPKTR